MVVKERPGGKWRRDPESYLKLLASPLVSGSTSLERTQKDEYLSDRVVSFQDFSSAFEKIKCRRQGVTKGVTNIKYVFFFCFAVASDRRGQSILRQATNLEVISNHSSISWSTWCFLGCLKKGVYIGVYKVLFSSLVLVSVNPTKLRISTHKNMTVGVLN